MGSIPGLQRSPGGGHGNPLQYSCLENPVDRGAWRAAVRRVTESHMPERLSTHTCAHSLILSSLPRLLVHVDSWHSGRRGPSQLLALWR